VKQVVTNKSGALALVDVPAPVARPGTVLVRTHWSLISAGTEGAQVREGKADLLTKVREHPDQVRQVLNKAAREGVGATLSQVKQRLEEWRELGYSLAGEVVEVGEGVEDFAPGDRVACAGAGYAVHAELVAVPRNLAAKVPGTVTLRQAAFVTLGAIALQGVRQAAPTLGERGLVIGLGLVGQLGAQLLRCSGVRVAVSDLDPARMELARRLGAERAFTPGGDLWPEISLWTDGIGFDLVLLSAATRSSEPVQNAARWTRDRGRIVVVGDVGLELERGPLYTKEIELRMSRSYGPGRYDPAYEEGGIDYPVGYVRWTEGRNLAAVLDLLGDGKVNVDELVTAEVGLDQAVSAFERLAAGEAGLGTLLRYPATATPRRLVSLSAAPPAAGDARVLVVGSGWFPRTHRLPYLGRDGLRVAGVISRSGPAARQLAEKAGASFAGTDLDEALRETGADAVLVATRHHLHVPQAVAAIEAGKHVLLEKPLALDAEGMTRIARALREHPVRFAVGFNRRHAPLARELRDRLRGIGGPVHGIYRMNAGRLPARHWVNDPLEGGGRILGEACHAFDFLCFLAAGDPATVYATPVRSSDPEVKDDDNLSATVTFTDGSVLGVLYSTAASPEASKERIEVFASGLMATLVDFRELSWSGAASGKKSLRAPDKGQRAETAAWGEYLLGKGNDVVEFPAAALSTWLTLRALESARTGAPLDVAASLRGVLGD
jgi:predicted dehydrogenase/threonine dehydrogenase-like Zn-dependent dehydrogenase